MVSSIAKVDAKGRILLSQEIRESLGFGPGDTVFLNVNAERHTLEVAKAINPFDLLAAEALAEHERGETVELSEFAREMGITLDD